VINFEILLPNKDPFQIKKITCKGLTFASFVSTRKKDLKLPKMNPSSLSSLGVPWRPKGNASFSTPLNPARGKCSCDGTDRWKNMRDGVGDREP
jgi:hypothetical protein